MKKNIVFILYFFVVSVIACGQQSMDVEYEVIEPLNDDFAALMKDVYENFQDCLDTTQRSPRNILSVVVSVQYNAFKKRKDTSVIFEVTPFFTWKDVGPNYSGVFKVNGAFVFLTEWQDHFWFERTGNYENFRQEMMGNYGDVPEYADTVPDSVEVLPNNIYSSIPCIYNFINKEFMRNESTDCKCDESE